jgi:hypothetical protein
MPVPAEKMTDTSGEAAAEVQAVPLEHKRIARLAYAYWQGRGRPFGSPEEDWFRAEAELRRKKLLFKIVKDKRPRASRARTSSRSRKSE